MFKFLKKEVVEDPTEVERNELKTIADDFRFFGFQGAYRFFKTDYDFLKRVLKSPKAHDRIEEMKNEYSNGLVKLLIYVYENIDKCAVVGDRFFINNSDSIEIQKYKSNGGWVCHFGHSSDSDRIMGAWVINEVIERQKLVKGEQKDKEISSKIENMLSNIPSLTNSGG